MNEITLESENARLPPDWFSTIRHIHDAVFLQPPFAWGGLSRMADSSG